MLKTKKKLYQINEFLDAKKCGTCKYFCCDMCTKQKTTVNNVGTCVSYKPFKGFCMKALLYLLLYADKHNTLRLSFLNYGASYVVDIPVLELFNRGELCIDRALDKLIENNIDSKWCIKAKQQNQITKKSKMKKCYKCLEVNMFPTTLKFMGCQKKADSPKSCGLLKKKESKESIKENKKEE